jgi:hypothetical protein
VNDEDNIRTHNLCFALIPNGRLNHLKLILGDQELIRNMGQMKLFYTG